MAQNLTDTIRRKQQRIVELQNEITALQAELKDARAILTDAATAPESTTMMLPLDKPKIVQHPAAARAGRTRAIKEGSTVWWARHLLKHWRHDEHIDTLISEIQRASGKPVSKPTVVSNLSRYVAKGDTFARPAESRYGLIDYDDEEEAVKAG
jgi:hypothetical protein